MPRRNNNLHPSRRNNRASSRANRETRQPNVISVWRMIDDKFSAAISDCVHGVDADYEEIPLFEKIQNTHKVFVLDPRRTKHTLAKGFEAGFNMRTAVDKVGGVALSSPKASINDIVIRRGRHLMASVSSEQLNAETLAVKTVLAEEGALGFRSSKVRHAAGGAVIYLGLISEDVRNLDDVEGKQVKDMIVEKVDLAFAMQSEVELSAVTFGDLTVTTRTH